MSDLRTFLSARYDEEEAAALEMLADRREWTMTGREVWSGGSVVAEASSTIVAFHVARYDPARVLREIQAKRKILARHCTTADGWCQGCGEDWTGHFRNPISDCQEIYDLAEIYGDHPDYQEMCRVLLG